MRHRRPLGRHRGVRLAARRRRRGQPARPQPDRPHAPGPGGRPPPGVACRPATSPATAGGRHPRNRSTTARSSSTSTGAARSTAPAAPAGTPESAEPHAGGARPLPQARPAASWGPPARPRWRPRPSSAARPGSRTAWSRPAGPGPASLGWPDAYAYTKALGERALLQQRGDDAGVDRAAVDHRVGVGRAPARLDPRLPHGRADHHQLRPRPAQGVPRRARGHRRRHPRRPGGGRGDRRGRRRAARRARDRAGGVGVDQPAALPPPRRPGARVVHRAPAVRQPRASRSSCPTGRSRAGAGSSASSSGPRAPSSGPSRRCSRCRCGASRRRGPPSSRSSARRPSGPSATSSCTAPTPSARRSTASTACWPGASALDADDQAAFCFDPRVIDWRHLRARRAPAVGRPARPRAHHARRAHQSRTGQDRLRRQVLAPERHFAAFDLENTLIASNVVASYSWLATRRLPRDDRLRYVLKTLAEAPSLLALDRRDRSDFLRHFYRRYDRAPVAQLDDDADRDVQPPDAGQVVPGRASAGSGSTAASATARVLITGALDFAIGPLRPLFDDVVCARLDTRPDGTYRGELADVPPTGEARASVLADYAAANGFDLAEARRLRRLDLRPADAGGGRVPRGRQPRDPAGRPGPQAGLAGRALRQGAPARPSRRCRSARRGSGGGGDRAADPRAHGRRVDRQRRATAAGDPPRPRGAGDEGPRVLPQAGPLRGGDGGRVAAARARRPLRPAVAARRRPARAAGVRAGCGCGPACRASAAATWPPSTAGRPATSSPSCRSRSRRATRSSATSRTAAGWW